MCLIIDNNKRDELFKSPLGDKERVIFDWIRVAGKLAIGGKLRRELLGSHKMVRLLAQLKLAGRLNEVEDSAVDRKEREVSKLPIESDDPHIIALALVSSARLLHTDDAALMRDFKNGTFVPVPRGKIFNGNVAMLRRDGFCPRCRAA